MKHEKLIQSEVNEMFVHTLVLSADVFHFQFPFQSPLILHSMQHCVYYCFRWMFERQKKREEKIGETRSRLKCFQSETRVWSVRLRASVDFIRFLSHAAFFVFLGRVFMIFWASHLTRRLCSNNYHQPLMRVFWFLSTVICFIEVSTSFWVFDPLSDIALHHH